MIKDTDDYTQNVVPVLVRLPNGAWVKPSSVTGVQPFESFITTAGKYIPPRVCIRGYDFMWSIDTADMDGAVILAAEIAEKLNSHVKGKP